MPIRPFLSGRAFDPETIDVMSEALKGVCETLSLKLVDGPETRLVAQKIVELMRRRRTREAKATGPKCQRVTNSHALCRY